VRRREIQVFSISFLDLLSGALGAVIILFITVPKSRLHQDLKGPMKPANAVSKMENKDFEKLEKELEESKMKMQEIIKEKDELKNMVSTLEEQAVRSMASPQEKKGDENSAISADVGFKFQGKRIVFLIDVSGSMYEQDRIGQVKAGLKMLITSMSSEFHIDVIFFPNGQEEDYGVLWGDVMPMTTENKSAVYEFLFDLEPYGHTPTRSALEYVLSRYRDATDIVLLSDGAPTYGISAKLDNINEILRNVKNTRSNRQINTIGVGSSFVIKNDRPEYLFLEKLAIESGGFFVGF
jgi:Mg-chelatase subunit ChlD